MNFTHFTKYVRRICTVGNVKDVMFVVAKYKTVG